MDEKELERLQAYTVIIGFVCGAIILASVEVKPFLFANILFTIGLMGGAVAFWLSGLSYGRRIEKEGKH